MIKHVCVGGGRIGGADVHTVAWRVLCVDAQLSVCVVTQLCAVL